MGSQLIWALGQHMGVRGAVLLNQMSEGPRPPQQFSEQLPYVALFTEAFISLLCGVCDDRNEHTLRGKTQHG